MTTLNRNVAIALMVGLALAAGPQAAVASDDQESTTNSVNMVEDTVQALAEIPDTGPVADDGSVQIVTVIDSPAAPEVFDYDFGVAIHHCNWTTANQY